MNIFGQPLHILYTLENEVIRDIIEDQDLDEATKANKKIEYEKRRVKLSRKPYLYYTPYFTHNIFAYVPVRTEEKGERSIYGIATEIKPLGNYAAGLFRSRMTKLDMIMARDMIRQYSESNMGSFGAAKEEIVEKRIVEDPKCKAIRRRHQRIHDFISQTFKVLTSAYISMFVVNWIDGWMIKIPYYNSYQPFMSAPTTRIMPTYNITAEMGVEYSGWLFSMTITQLLICFIIAICFIHDMKRVFRRCPVSLLFCMVVSLIPFIGFNIYTIGLSQPSRDNLFLNPAFNPFNSPVAYISVRNQTTGFYAAQPLTSIGRSNSLLIEGCMFNWAYKQAQYNASLSIDEKAYLFFTRPWAPTDIGKIGDVANDCHSNDIVEYKFEPIKIEHLEPIGILERVRNRLKLHIIFGGIMEVIMVIMMIYYIWFFMAMNYTEHIEKALHLDIL